MPKKQILAIAIDMFSPGAYRASVWPGSEGPRPDFVEDYAHEQNYVYIVLQPLLFRGTRDPAAPVDVLCKAADYFVAGRQLSASDIIFVDGNLLRQLPASLVPVPVALPPDCELCLDLWRDDGSLWTTGKRVIGTDAGTGGNASPFVLELNTWPEIAAINFAHPLATVFTELDRSQQEQVYVWLGAAVVDLLRQAKARPRAPLTPAQCEALQIFEVSDPFPTPKLMREHLASFGRGSRMYDLLLADKAPVKPGGVHLSVPRFKIVDCDAFAARIQSDIRAALPPAPPRASYLQVWWATMCEQALREPANTWSDLSKESELAMVLSRYFGFGERLRWPTPEFDVTGPDNKFFMVPRPPSGCRFETNAASLCELVFRIPVSALQGEAAKHRITLTVAGASLDDKDRTEPCKRLAWLLREMSDTAARWMANRTCHAQAWHDQHDEAGKPMDDAHGLVLVQTRSAKCVQIANAPQPNAYAVPSVFYDLVDTSARLSRNDDGDGLTLSSSLRRALFPEECLAFDEATAGWSTAWGVQGDLHAAAVSVLQHDSKMPRVYEFVASRLSSTVVYRVAETETASEALRFKSIVDDVLTFRGRYVASLWLPNGARAFDLTHTLIDADGSESDLRFYILDEDPSIGIGKALVAAGVDSSKAIGVEIVISVRPGYPDAASAKRYLPFNRVFGNAAGVVPWIALERSALTRVSQSVDRWIERFHVKPQVTGPAAASTDPVLAHLSNFNKLRVYRRRNDSTYFPITYPDAAVPLQPAEDGAYGKSLPWKSGWPLQPPFSYFVAHLYSQENATERPGIQGAYTSLDRTLDRTPEMMRYERYVHPRRSDWITGYLEHQYSYRIPVLGAQMTVDARIATDVRNLAGLAARAQGSAAALDLAQTEQEGLRSPLLELCMSVDGHNLQIACRRDYLRAALGTQDNAVQMQGGARNTNVDTLRSLYEAVQDFMAALVDGQADLVAHLYRFDNQLPRAQFDSAGAQSIPARLHRFMTGWMQLRVDDDPGQALVQGLRSLAAPSFAAFQAEVERLLTIPDKDIFPPVHVDLQHSRWVWQQDSSERPAPDLQGEVNIVRVALDLFRSPERVVDESCAKGRFIPLTPEDNSPEPKWIYANREQVLSNAKTELAELVQRPGSAAPGSSLFFRRDWLSAQPPVGKVTVGPATGTDADPAMEPRDKRWKLIFGDYAPTVLAPPGRMKDVQRVCEMFYVPLAFLPLQEHPALASANETTLFAEFLLRIAGEILEGTPISSIPIMASAPNQAAQDAVRARLRLEKLSRADGGIGNRLQELVHAVHNAEDLRLNTDPLVVRALACMDANAVRTGQALRALLSTAPQTYATARAIGLVLFDQTQDRFSRSLQSIQLCKRISQNMHASQKDGLVDVDRFVIPPTPAGTGALLLDPLESARYDSEFELLQNVYDGLPDGTGTYDVPLDLDGTVQLTARGGVSGRTGEDFVESRNHFPVPGDDSAVPRAVEVDAPHWNPHWAYQVAGSPPRQLYLLPSRRFPLAPVMLQVSAAKAPEGRTVTVSGTSINITDLDGTDPQKVFESAVETALQDTDGAGLVIRADGALDQSQQPTEWKIDNKSTRMATHVESAGWHRIDTFLEHHYFLVESGETADGDDAFANDVFEIDVQVNRDRQPVVASAPPPGPATVKVGATSNLLEAFRSTQLDAGAASSAPAPVVGAMSLPALAESVVYWLCDVPVDTGLIPDDEKAARFNDSLLREAQQSSTSADVVHFRGTYAIAHPRHNLVLEGPLQAVPEMSERIGSIVTATTFTPSAAEFTERGQRRILRVTVLADPWSRLQVRVKQVRNQRNVDRGKPDMDAAFAMSSPHSSWSCYAHSEYVVDASLFALSNVPASERRLEVTNVSLEQWVNDTAAGGKPDIGGLVAARLSAVVQGQGAYKGLPYWTHKQMMSPQRMVSVVLRQRQPDRHILHDENGGWKSQHERDLSVPRHVFGIISADQVDAILRVIAPGTVTAGEPELEITWLDQASDGPVYRVTWPIRFQNLRKS